MAPKKKAHQGASTRPTASSQPVPQPPNWPVFAPLVPEADLALQELLPAQVVTIPNFWTAALCRTYVSFLSSLPLTTTPGTPKKGDAVRVNDRYQIHDPTFAERLWSGTALKSLITSSAEEGALGLSDEQRKELWGGEVAGLNPNIRVYRYSKGQFFDQHYDDSNRVIIPGSSPIPTRTTWTLLLYLTAPATGCIGGETVFYPDPPRKKSRDPPPEPLVVELQVGLALLHRHGADCMLHEGREVIEGEKWVIRTDLCVKC
ncbi:hypothetical protein BDW02DRAFT_493460 [Decorospora gaudefroyi]|uniref:Prolyl 4-hydroxylase alpha subunit domain-containing protein n=1 Tax=Decorospora gaudefroyi TaxID=184978 RepID=A0A6A5KSA0_9PLEO|nr:hypothetical protein BDW02DRAFT_493460 [Decorospora gaudefroyi]